MLYEGGCTIVVAFVGEYWVVRKSGLGKQSHQDYVSLVSLSSGAQVACHVRRDLVAFCELVECANRFVYMELGGVRIGGVYSKCGARVHETIQWLDGIQASIGNGRWVLIADWNAHHVSWFLDGNSDRVGRVLEEWRSTRGARLVRGRKHTFERRCGNRVVMSRIDVAIAGRGMEPSSLTLGFGLSVYSAIGCVVAVDDLEDVVGYRHAVDWLKVQMPVADEREA